MTSGRPWKQGDLVRVKPGHGTRDDLSPWMETIPAKAIEVPYDPTYGTLVSWNHLGPSAPEQVRRHTSWRGGWYIGGEHLELARTPNTTHEAW